MQRNQVQFPEPILRVPPPRALMHLVSTANCTPMYTYKNTHTQNSTHIKSQKSINEWVEIVNGQGDVWLFPKWNDLKMLKWIWEILRHRAIIVDKILTQAKSRKFRNILWNDWNKRFLVKNLKNSLVLNVTALLLMMVFIHSIAIY